MNKLTSEAYAAEGVHLTFLKLPTSEALHELHPVTAFDKK